MARGTPLMATLWPVLSAQNDEASNLQVVFGQTQLMMMMMMKMKCVVEMMSKQWRLIGQQDEVTRRHDPETCFVADGAEG